MSDPIQFPAKAPIQANCYSEANLATKVNQAQGLIDIYSNAVCNYAEANRKLLCPGTAKTYPCATGVIKWADGKVRVIVDNNADVVDQLTAKGKTSLVKTTRTVDKNAVLVRWREDEAKAIEGIEGLRVQQQGETITIKPNKVET